MAKLFIAGATGLIGSELAKQLSDPDDTVILLSRRAFEPPHAHHQVLQTDLLTPNLPSADSQEDTFFCALGTTIKKAGSQPAFYQVDHDMVVAVATAAYNAGYQRFVVVSSLGVQSNTRNFYLQTKHKMEQSISRLGFKHVTIIRPSLLLGDRGEFRLGEKIGEWASVVLTPLLVGSLRKYRPIPAATVAKAMLRSRHNQETGLTVLESDALVRLAAE
ncbi:NAD(P)H-binding protein [Reinekea blandensis]|uniref:Nucleoside-diphosphate-sugar epimerase n=1 Tax=Reinekea blandensis MED297 TaxID=314283 RepID=A4B9E1_9GAMM|nr:NAD(P)H-binding protein [Reinekea blandensis]EAR11242.1 nucleoside-diphosphate-sugar epimerase [Reinekea sp. MED297] [Reinekea blandensis MED297]